MEAAHQCRYKGTIRKPWVIIRHHRHQSRHYIRLSNIQNKVENMVARSKGNDPTRLRGRNKDKER